MPGTSLWLEENRYWDDQDLALAALVDVECPVDGAAQMGAVLCDDAQDLTRAELALVLRLAGGRCDEGSGRLRLCRCPSPSPGDHLRGSLTERPESGVLLRALTIELSTASVDDRPDAGSEVELDTGSAESSALTHLHRVVRGR